MPIHSLIVTLSDWAVFFFMLRLNLKVSFSERGKRGLIWSEAVKINQAQAINPENRSILLKTKIKSEVKVIRSLICGVLGIKKKKVKPSIWTVSREDSVCIM